MHEHTHRDREKRAIASALCRHLYILLVAFALTKFFLFEIMFQKPIQFKFKWKSEKKMIFCLCVCVFPIRFMEWNEIFNMKCYAMIWYELHIMKWTLLNYCLFINYSENVLHLWENAFYRSSYSYIAVWVKYKIEVVELIYNTIFQ